MGSNETSSEVLPKAVKKRGGARPGAGGPSGPTAKTRERQAYLASIVKDVVLAEAFEHVTALDIMEIACRKLLEMGKLTEAAEVAAKLAPYRHGKQPTVTVMRAEVSSTHSILAEMANDEAPPLIPQGKVG